EAGLRLGRATGQHDVAACRRLLSGRQPKRGLADPRLPGDHGGRGQLIGRIEEANERPELLVPANEAMRADSHDSVLPRFYDSEAGGSERAARPTKAGSKMPRCL